MVENQSMIYIEEMMMIQCSPDLGLVIKEKLNLKVLPIIFHKALVHLLIGATLDQERVQIKRAQIFIILYQMKQMLKIHQVQV